MMKMINDLIVVKQLPIIEEQLKIVSKEIDEKLKNVEGLVCTEENKQAVKKIRTEFKKEFTEYEAKRKAVKEQIMQPYNDFNKIYEECIANKFKAADEQLKNKIDIIEKEQKKQLEDEAKKYFEEYKNEKNLDFISFERMNLKIGLSDSLSKLKKQIEEFINQRINDLNLIELQEHKAEILVEYKQSLNASQAITAVSQRLKAIEEEKKIQEKLEHAVENKIITPTDKEMAINFVEEAKKRYKDEFVIVPTKKIVRLKLHLLDEEIEKVKRFLEISNIEYESEEL